MYTKQKVTNFGVIHTNVHPFTDRHEITLYVHMQILKKPRWGVL